MVWPRGRPGEGGGRSGPRRLPSPCRPKGSRTGEAVGGFAETALIQEGRQIWGGKDGGWGRHGSLCWELRCLPPSSTLPPPHSAREGSADGGVWGKQTHSKDTAVTHGEDILKAPWRAWARAQRWCSRAQETGSLCASRRPLPQDVGRWRFPACV